MNLSSILLQAQLAVADTAQFKNVTKKISSLSDSLANVTPEKIHQGVTNFDWHEVISMLTTTGVSVAMHILFAVLVFVVGRFLIIKAHNLLRNIMMSRNVDRSLTTFLLSLFKITFFFILAITVIGILGIETGSLIAILASAGIAIGMALSGTLQNFAGGVLILLLKPYRVGDYIEFETHKGTVKEIQIFHTIITTYNNESIIIPNGGLSTGTINNYSKEHARRLEWRVGISYGDDVDKAREVILNIIDGNDMLLKPGAENDHISTHAQAVESSSSTSDGNKGSWFKRWMQRHKELQEKAAEWREEKRKELDEKMPKVDYTPSVSVESLDDSSVTLVVRAWVKHADYWPAFYNVNEAIYKQLPLNGLRFPFPQMDVHLDK